MRPATNSNQVKLINPNPLFGNSLKSVTTENIFSVFSARKRKRSTDKRSLTANDILPASFEQEGYAEVKMLIKSALVIFSFSDSSC